MVVSRLTVFRMHPCVPPRDGWQKGWRREEKRSQWMKGRASAMNVERMVRQIRRFFSVFQARRSFFCPRQCRYQRQSIRPGTVAIPPCLSSPRFSPPLSPSYRPSYPIYRQFFRSPFVRFSFLPPSSSSKFPLSPVRISGNLVKYRSNKAGCKKTEKRRMSSATSSRTFPVTRHLRRAICGCVNARTGKYYNLDFTTQKFHGSV